MLFAFGIAAICAQRMIELTQFLKGSALEPFLELVLGDDALEDSREGDFVSWWGTGVGKHREGVAEL